MKKLCVVLGGGGHAKVLIELLQSMAEMYLCGILDADPGRWGIEVQGVRILGDDGLLPQLREKGVEYFIVGLGSTGNNRPRQRLFGLALGHGFRPLRAIHPSAIVSPSAEIGDGSAIMAGAILGASSRVGKNVIVNTGAIIEHDCVVGDHAHVATGARLASTVSVGDGAHIGVGAVVRQCIRVGAGALVGAGAVVVGDIPPRVVVGGVPARPLSRSMTSEAKEEIS